MRNGGLFGLERVGGTIQETFFDLLLSIHTFIYFASIRTRTLFCRAVVFDTIRLLGWIQKLLFWVRFVYVYARYNDTRVLSTVQGKRCSHVYCTNLILEGMHYYIFEQ
jgi:hypothetical protein